MEIITTIDNVGYEKNFDARKYLESYYGVDPETQEIDKESKFLLKFLSNIFASGRVKGQSFIEFGVGPTIHYILSACETIEKIYLTDYFQGNLDEIKKWLNYEEDAFDWSPYLRYVCDLESNGSTPKSKEKKIRNKVSLIKGDVTLSNPLHPNSLPLTDCVLLTGCLICTCKNFTDFKIVLKNIVSMIKPGGHLIIIDYIGASYYHVGDVTFPLLTLDENIVREAVAESGCKLEEFQLFTDFQVPFEIFDCKTVFCLLAKKL
ncbi:nicotinamide N-methyltransferase-like [Dendropsophus ebraccatus]|uniref:nicotinamide N-methyltransferase-like n=1 Tax=Dendropsophus ebraccatus TaxID=150705 RepID=UPI0038317490